MLFRVLLKWNLNPGELYFEHIQAQQNLVNSEQKKQPPAECNLRLQLDPPAISRSQYPGVTFTRRDRTCPSRRSGDRQGLHSCRPLIKKEEPIGSSFLLIS